MTRDPADVKLSAVTANRALYDTDFHAWAFEQAALLRAGRVSEADIAHIAEEIESMGRSEKRELVTRLTVLLTHLLKWRHQPTRRTRSWRLTSEHQRIRIAKHLSENPSLNAAVGDIMLDAYDDARLDAERETRLDRQIFPPVCPWTFDEAMRPDFWPDEIPASR